jgi:hypothetical protein
VTPGPSFSSTHRRPPWRSTMDRLIDRPSPIPPAFVV